MKRRLPAEWEPQSAVQFTFPHMHSDWAPVLSQVNLCFKALIETVSRFEPVLVVCQDKKLVRPFLKEIDPKRLRLVEIDSNDTWARDHGGITVFENGNPILLDFMFNGWGLKFPADKDNLITGKLYEKGIFQADQLECPGLVLEGGALESDGKGTLMTTVECLSSPNRNPHLDLKALESKLKEIFGLERILWLHHGYLAGDDTDSHIDTLARFCDSRTIAYVQCTDQSDEHYGALSPMEEELRAFRTLSGDPYRLVPLPLPDPVYDENGRRLPATYANFLIINGAVLVPTYRVSQDEQVLEIFRDIFLDREVVGVDCHPLIWQHGSLHCVTMQYPEGVVGFGIRDS